MRRAVDAGATVIMPVADQFWGDRYGALKDPFGHNWSLATHKQQLTPEQIREIEPYYHNPFGETLFMEKRVER